MPNELPPPPPLKKKVSTKQLVTKAERRKFQANKEVKRARKATGEVSKLVKEAKKDLSAIEKLEKIAKKTSKTAIIETNELDLAPESLIEDIKTDPDAVIFVPNEGPQTDFLASSEREVLYGGAAGGGKTMAMIVDPLRYCANPNHRALLLRHTNDELREIVSKTKEIYPKAYPGAKWSEQKSTWTFPSGAMIWLTYLDRDDDVLRYTGQAFNWIGFDELTHWSTPYAWEYMRSRLRSADPTLPLCMRASCNPGNVGAWWVRKMFIDPAVPGQAFWATNIETGETLEYPPNHAKAGQPLFKRRFIPAKLSDNPHLYESGDYETNLLSLPEAQRRRLLEGDWDIVEGAAFQEFSRLVHVVQPYKIPEHWTRFRGADWGFSSPGCVLWFAVSPDNELIVYRELYFRGLNATEVGNKVMDLEQSEYVSYGVLDVSAWSRRGDIGPSIAETMNKMGCRWKPSGRVAAQGARNSRISGKMEVHRRLAIDSITKKPRLTIFNTCANLIRTLPTLPLDKTDPEDVDTKAEDHAYDALRYGVMSRPLASDTNHRTTWDIRHNRTWQPANATFGY